MNKGLFQRLLPHIAAVLIFLVVAVVFCSPSLSGKVLNHSDVTQWKGMAQESLRFKEANGHLPLWTNSAFAGMPAYQIALESQNFISVGFAHHLFTLFLPKPVAFFFLACLAFYFLAQCVRVNPWISILAALGYAYATYNPVIVATGHDTKMLTLAYMPAMLGSLILLYEKRYWLGGALTALFTALFIGQNHLQIAYYFLLVAAIMTIAYVYHWIKAKDYKHIGLALGIALVAGLTGVLANATNIFVTYDYSKATMRNGTLSIDTASGQQKTAGLPIDYAFQWSYGKAETMTLLVPRVFGGSNGEKVTGETALGNYLAQRGAPADYASQIVSSFAYWGPQPFTSGPVYLGALICFLFLFGMVYLNSWHRWWMLAACVLAILMSWGKNFEGFNTFLFNYLPFYNKFRAPSTSLVIPQLLFPLLGALALQRLFFGEISREETWKKFKLTAYIAGGFLAIAFLFYLQADYRGPDAQAQQVFEQVSQGQPQAATEMYQQLQDDRQALFGGDLARSFFIILGAALLLGLFIRNRLGFGVVLGGLLLLNAIDLFGVARRYLSSESFVEDIQSEEAFLPSIADQQILQDTGYYRVINLSRDVFQDAITSYHHNSIGGYHPAKLAITEDLLDYQLRNKQPMNVRVLNMLNTRYFIFPNQQGGQPVAQQNPETLGHAWFVRGIDFRNDALSVMKALDNFNPRDTAILFAEDRAKVPASGAIDSAGAISLVYNANDEIVYRSQRTTPGFAVFSEIYYDRGWKAYIDGKETDIIRTNYVLRGLPVPAGNHEIRFAFRPASYYTGETVSLIANVLILLFLIFAGYQAYRLDRKRTRTDA